MASRGSANHQQNASHNARADTQSPQIDSMEVSGAAAGPPTDQDISVAPNSAAPKPQQSQEGLARLDSVEGMSIFRKEVDKRTLDRFQDVVERVQAQLIEYLRKNTKEYRPMAIRLMILGHSEESAKPWMVVLCPAHTGKKVKKFFNKKSIRSICQSGDSHDVGFEVAVVTQGIRPKASDEPIDVYGIPGAYSDGAYWKIPLRVHQNGVARYATMGGVIKITMPNGMEVFHGLTVGHILEHNDDPIIVSTPSDEADEVSSSPTSSEDEDDSADDETIMEDTTNEDYSSAHQIFDATAEYPLAVPRARSQGWTEIGTISKVSSSILARNRDWALIEDVQDFMDQPNELNIPSHDPFLAEGKTKSLTTGAALDVISLRQEGAQTSNVSCLPAMALMPAGHSFVSVYALHIADELVLGAGSCGSWLISASTQTVYGHIVADDLFGDIYTVPILDTFADIQTALNAKSVSLPDAKDIRISSHSIYVEPAEPELTKPRGTKPPVIHNGGGCTFDPNTSTSAPNAGYYN